MERSSSLSALPEFLSGCGFEAVGDGALRLEGTYARPHVATDPRRLTVEAEAGTSAQLVLLHAASVECEVIFRLAEGADLSVVQIFTGEAFVSLEAEQAARSRFRLMTAQLAGSNSVGRVVLGGPGAECDLQGLLLLAEREHGEMSVRIEHRSADCRSLSLAKGVAGGEARGVFRGLVYVAPGAQHTDARQLSRNLLVGRGARIETLPQLEIYADDVQCSHGATVGQMDDEALFYMRQRGLSETQARALRLGGFAGEVVLRSPVEPLRAPLAEAVAAKLERM